MAAPAQTIETQLAKFANKNGKAVHLLENLIKVSMLFCNALTFNEQLKVHRFICTYIKTHGKIQDSIETIIAAYAKQDMQGIHLGLLPTTMDMPRAAKKLYHALVTERDQHMVKRLHTLIHQQPKNAKGFVAVGCLHLPGMVKQLMTLGYQVKPCMLTPATAVCSPTLGNGVFDRTPTPTTEQNELRATASA